MLSLLSRVLFIAYLLALRFVGLRIVGLLLTDFSCCSHILLLLILCFTVALLRNSQSLNSFTDVFPEEVSCPPTSLPFGILYFAFLPLFLDFDL